MENVNCLHGYDWHELVRAWNLPVSDLDEEGFKTFLENFVLPRTFWGTQTRFTKRVCKDIRTYLKLLSFNDPSYYRPVWKTLSEIEDDFSLVAMFSEVFGFAWA